MAPYIADVDEIFLHGNILSIEKEGDKEYETWEYYGMHYVLERWSDKDGRHTIIVECRPC